MGANSWSRSYYTILFRLVMTYSYNGARKMFCNSQEELINMSYFITISFLSFATFATFGGRFGKHQDLRTRYNYCSIPSLQCSIFSLFHPASYHPSSPRGIPHVEEKTPLIKHDVLIFPQMSVLFKGPGWTPGKPRLGDPADLPQVLVIHFCVYWSKCSCYYSLCICVS